jgi:hypothetical protein
MTHLVIRAIFKENSHYSKLSGKGPCRPKYRDIRAREVSRFGVKMHDTLIGKLPNLLCYIYITTYKTI